MNKITNTKNTKYVSFTKENPEPGRNCLNCETLYSIHCLNKIIPRQRRQHRFSGEEESQLQQPRSCDATNVNTKVEPQRGDSLRRRKSKLQVPTPNNLCYGTVAGFMDGEGFADEMKNAKRIGAFKKSMVGRSNEATFSSAFEKYEAIIPYLWVLDKFMPHDVYLCIY
ncbi:uncharacterized protein HKW66_Vig0206610 [Vigna angularis]|uniref:Uncharacterized protein n=1 Tax=Phaseolus angularis TaxID=3914 RepID=A0A8T0JJV2_PHAAN|nr:uncharacterized protein HKW66_Vig0206610 [Vigna angularis]